MLWGSIVHRYEPRPIVRDISVYKTQRRRKLRNLRHIRWLRPCWLSSCISGKQGDAVANTKFTIVQPWSCGQSRACYTCKGTIIEEGSGAGRAYSPNPCNKTMGPLSKFCWVDAEGIIWGMNFVVTTKAYWDRCWGKSVWISDATSRLGTMTCNLSHTNVRWLISGSVCKMGRKAGVLRQKWSRLQSWRQRQGTETTALVPWLDSRIVTSLSQ